MNEICCYILYSRKIDKYYVGATQDSVDIRLEKHNGKYYGNSAFSSQTNDWQLFLKIEVMDFKHALRLEKKIKSMKSKKYINNLLIYKELIEKIIEETKEN